MAEANIDNLRRGSRSSGATDSRMPPPQMTKELRQRAQMPVNANGNGRTLRDFFSANKASIEAALPQHVNSDRMLKVAVHAVRTTPQLQKCTVESLFGAVIQCSTLGLEPNTVLGHAYLVPFWNGRERRTDVQVIVGYKGLIDLARRSGHIESLTAHAVREGEPFEVALGTEGKITHRPRLDGNAVGDIIAFYAVAKFKDGGYQFDVMTREEVDRIRDGSQGYKNAIKKDKGHPWINHYEAMGKKTVVRRLSKYLPLSVELATAVELDGMAEGGKDQGFRNVLDGEFNVLPDDAPPADADESDDPTPEPEPEPAPEPRQRTQAAPQAPEPAPEWPERFRDKETGEVGWVDSDGQFFNEDLHLWDTDAKRPQVDDKGCFVADERAQAEDPKLPLDDPGDISFE